MSDGDSPAVAARISLAFLAAVVVVGVLGVAVVATDTTTAQSDDEDAPPALHSAEKINTTAVEVLLVDDTGIAIDTIDADDFLLSDGELSHVTADTAGTNTSSRLTPNRRKTNASVTLVLSAPLSEDELRIGIASDSDIRNQNGTNIRTDGSNTVTVTGMDGVAPRVLGTDVGDAIGSPAKIEFRFDEQLSGIDVEIAGPANTTLGIDDFDNPVSNRYVARYTPPESGTYNVSLTNVTDAVGNTRTLSLSRRIRADKTDPEAIIGIDFGSSSGVNVTFDASQSSGNELTYNWDFGDGTTKTGEEVFHEFTPAEHTITLTVRDGFGNTDQDTVDLNLTGGLDSGSDVERENETAGPAVIIDREGEPEARGSLVSVTEALAGAQLDIGTAGGGEATLVGREAFSVDRVTVTPTVDTSFSLALSGLRAGEVTEAAATEAAEIGGFRALTDLEDTEVATAEFIFSIDARRLDVLGVSPTDVELRREAGGEWSTPNTTVLVEDGDSYRFAAETPGFSRFAIVGTNASVTPSTDDSDTQDGSTDEESDSRAPSSIEITEATVEPTEIPPGEPVEITATLENSGERDGSFRAALERDGAVIDTSDVAVEAGDSETVQFTRVLDEPGSVSFAVNGTDAGTVTVEESDQSPTEETPTPTDQLDVEEDAFTVTNVTLNESSISPGEVILIEGDVVNRNDSQANFLAELEVDGEVVDTFEVPAVPGGENIPVSFTRRFNESGTYTISISGTESEPELAVGQGGGMLDFLPLGILQTVLAFVGVPLIFFYLVLKAVAFYLGY